MERLRRVGDAIARPLCGEHGSEQKGDAASRDVEVEPSHAVHEQGRKRANLIQARIGHAGSSSGPRTIPPGFLARGRMTGQSLHVRPARETEIDQLAKLWLDGWRDAHELIVPAELT